MNAYLIISSLLNFSAALVLALTAFVTTRRNFGSLSFGAFSLAVGLWSGAYCLWRLAETPATALFFSRLLILGAIFIPITLFHFAFVLAGGTRRGVLWLGYAIAVVLAALNFTPLLVASVKPTAFGLWPQAGIWFGAFLVFFFAFTVGALAQLLFTPGGLGTNRSQRRIVAFVLTIGFLGGSTNFPLWYGLPVPPVGNGLVFLYLAMLGYAVAKYRLPNLQQDLVKSAVFLGISATVGVIFVLLSLATDRLIGATATTTASDLTARFFFTVLASAFAMWAVPRIVELAEKFLEQNLLKESYRMQRELKELVRTVGAESEEAEIFRAAADRLWKIFQAPEIAIYFHGELEPIMRLCAEIPAGRCARELPENHALLLGLAQATGSVSAERHSLGGARRRLRSDREALRALGFELAVPMRAENRLAGVILLNRPLRARDDSEAVMSLLEAVALQIALTITARRLERRANQADKLIAIGTLAAGLAHELRNPLTSIHTFAALMNNGVDAGSDPGFVRTVLRDAQRITSIVENVSAFATNPDLAMGPVEIAKVLSSTVEITTTEFSSARVTMRVLCNASAPVHGNYGQLQQVFLNLIQNAIQAIGPSEGEVEISADPIVLTSGRSGVRVTVRDSGPGVAPEVMARVFEPFVTTKATGERLGKRGLGLGLAIVKRIIEAHHGDIRLESAPGRGASFFVYLPCHTDS